MTGAFSVLSPIMPLLLPKLGVETVSREPMGRHPQRRHLICGGVRFAGLGTDRRPARAL